MAKKSDILNNLREYTSDQIAEAINAGTVTLYELSKSGNLTPLMRRRIEEKLAAKPSSEVLQVAQEDKPADQVVVPPPILERREEEVTDYPEVVETDDYPEIAVSEPSVVAPVVQPIYENSNEEPSTSDSYKKSKKGMFKRPFSFSGRIRRLEYGLSLIIFYLWFVVVMAIAEDPSLSPETAIILLASYIPALWFYWAQSCKRFHDRGYSGFYIFLYMIPLYNIYLFFVQLFGEGDVWENEYGDCPKD